MTSSRRFRTVDLTKGAMFIALMAIGANLTAYITIGTVPLTLQTVLAILAGILLGKQLGAFSMIGYFIVGLAGIPVFAGFTGGFHVFSLPTFGFILSFIVIAYVVGLIMENAKRWTATTFMTAGFAGLLINYGIGVPYMYFHSHIILEANDVQFLTVAAGMTPFLLKDVILVFFTIILAPQLLKAVNHKSELKKAS